MLAYICNTWGTMGEQETIVKLMPRRPPVFHDSLPLDNRLTLRKHFCDRLPWITGTEVEAWLFLIEPGRYRLLSDEDVQKDIQLEPVRALALQDKSIALSQPSDARPIRDAAIVAKLIPITVGFHNGSWRVLLPEDLGALAPADTDTRALSSLMPEGYLEIWYSDVLRRALDSPWRKRQ
jgi:hypothetical protein